VFSGTDSAAPVGFRLGYLTNRKNIMTKLKSYSPICPVCAASIGSYVKDGLIITECLCKTCPILPEIKRDDDNLLIWTVAASYKYRYNKANNLIEVFYEDNPIFSFS
jgi:hypothetical protein